MRRRLVLAGALGAALLALAVYVGREAWIARKLAYLDGLHPAFNKCSGSEPASEAVRKRLYVVGGATAHDWPLYELDARYEAVDCGVGGETTAQLARRFDRFDFLRSGDVVLLAAGIHDAIGASFLSPEKRAEQAEKTVARLADLARAAHEAGGFVIVATIPPPSRPDWLRRPVWREEMRDFTEKANAGLRAERWGQGIALLDVAAALGGDDRRTPDAYRGNGWRINDSGFAALSAAVNRALPEAR